MIQINAYCSKNVLKSAEKNLSNLVAPLIWKIDDIETFIAEIPINM